jgi:hypothetical protein
LAFIELAKASVSWRLGTFFIEIMPPADGLRCRSSPNGKAIAEVGIFVLVIKQ